MIRRSFMSMLGLAPIAAAMPVNGVAGTGSLSSSASYVPFGGFNQVGEQIDNVEYARKRLDALKWVSSKNLPGENEHFAYQDPAIHVESMRSWSHSHKARVTSELRRARDREIVIKAAENRFERELKLSLAPDWVRRFL